MIAIKNYGGFDLKDLQLLGQGTQGKVYGIDSHRCIKVFKSKTACRDELLTLMIAQKNSHFPQFFEAGKNYIIRECINGIELNRYLSTHALTPELSNKILRLYDAMQAVGYTRLDAAIFHIFVTTDSNLKLIDTSKSLKKSATCPKLILKGLDEVGYRDEFLNFVRQSRPMLYERWIEYQK